MINKRIAFVYLIFLTSQTRQQTVEKPAWKIFIEQNDQFSCVNKVDSFYPSRWCNVYYRCFNSIKTEFICPKDQSGATLWWMQHSSLQSIPHVLAQCQWPCDIGRRCTSPGGVLKLDPIIEGIDEAQRTMEACPDINYNLPNGKYIPQINNGFIAQTNKKWSDENFNVNSNVDFKASKNGPGSYVAQKGGIIEDFSDDLFKISEIQNPCIGLEDGSFISSPFYCNVYHVCVKGARKDFLCSSGSGVYDLWWNDNKKLCDWPCKVQCDKKIFGSVFTAKEISDLDRKKNEYLC